MRKRMLSMLLCFVLILGLLPSTVFAADISVTIPFSESGTPSETSGEGWTYDPGTATLTIKQGYVLSGNDAQTVDCFVSNYGTLKKPNWTYAQTVTNFGTIESGSFTYQLINTEDGTITGMVTLGEEATLLNSGTIASRVLRQLNTDYPGKVKTVKETEEGEFVGVSSVRTEVFEALGFDTDPTGIQAQAADSATPYGKGYMSLIPSNELLALTNMNQPASNTVYNAAARALENPLGGSFGGNLTSSEYSYATDLAGATAMRSVAFDAAGTGKDEYIAILSAHPVTRNGRVNTEIRLTVSLPTNIAALNSTANSIGSLSGGAAAVNLRYKYTTVLTTLPFEVYPENAGAWLSIAAGNFDGDEKGIEEIAFYKPWSGTYRSGTITIMAVTNAGKAAAPRLSSIKEYDLHNRSSYYFPDNRQVYQEWSSNRNAGDWKYQYYVPAVNVETVPQPGDTADDLCVTFTATMGGALGTAGINRTYQAKALQPWDCATGVFFWIDPAASGGKVTDWYDQMRDNWEDDYGVTSNLDKDAYKKNEVMVFGSAGAGDLDMDGTNEVVIAGYLLGERDDSDDGNESGDWNISNNEFMITYYTYSDTRKTYDQVQQPMSWISMREDEYAGATNYGEGIYTDYGGKDMTHSPLPVTLFAERGSNYGDSVAAGGIIARFDANSLQSAWTPYPALSAAMFDSGTFAGVYTIPDESLHRQFKGNYNASDPMSITNRLYTETVAGNFNDNLAGQEQLAFSYTAKRSGETEYHIAYGVIGQKEPGDLDNVANTDKRGDKFLSSNITYRAWVPATGHKVAAMTVGAVDPDNDSTLMRHSGKPNEYYFSDPEIIAVLQAAPFFADLPYLETGETSLEITESHIQDKANGVSASVSVQGGASVMSGKLTVLGGIYAETSKVWGDVWTKTTAVGYTALDTNSVALVMTPYVRYHYEVYSPESGVWDPITVNVPQLPRPTMISVKEYDNMAAIEGWPQIMGNILNNVEGYPSTYDTDLSGKKNFLGGDVPGTVTENKGDDFIRVGSGSSGDISQTIGRSHEEYSDFTWGAGAAESLSIDLSGTATSGFALDQNASIGYTGSYTKSRFDGQDFTGKVSSIPAGYPEYTFYWRFCTWEETMHINGKDQTFRVLGYMVKNVENPPLQGNYLHVVDTGTNSVTLSWRGALQELNRDGLQVSSQGYGLYRERNGVYYPLVNLGHSEAEHNWFTFTDPYVEPFTQYDYVIRSYAFYNHQLMYGTYSQPVTAYTAPDLENLPSVYVVDSGESGGKRTLTAYVTSATGNVGSLMVQWQVYDRTGGGWVNCKITDRQSAGGDTLLSLLTLDGADTQKQYRCQVTQRVDNEIYTIYSGDRKGGYVYVAAKQRVTVDGESLTRYTLVNENGTVETVDASYGSYNTGYVYLRKDSANGELTLTTNDYTKQKRSVTLVEDDIVEVNGGLSYASDGGGDFLLMEASQVWDVTTYQNPKRDTLEKNNLISYVVNSDGTLRAAFISGTRNWSPPSDDDDDGGGSTPSAPQLTVTWGNDPTFFYLILADEQPTTANGLTATTTSSQTVTCQSGQTVYLVLGTGVTATGAAITNLGGIESDYSYTSLYSFTMGSSNATITLNHDSGD